MRIGAYIYIGLLGLLCVLAAFSLSFVVVLLSNAFFSRLVVSALAYGAFFFVLFVVTFLLGFSTDSPSSLCLYVLSSVL